MIDYSTTPKIKICGICSVEDAQLAIKYEVEYIGLIFVKSSPRYVEPVIAKSIANTVGDKMQVVGVFQNSTLQEMENISSLVGLNYFQLHGHESPDLCGSLSKPVIKVFQIAHELTCEEPCISVPLLKPEAKQEIENYPSILEKYKPYCQHFLFDKPKKFTKDNKHNWPDLARQRLRPMEKHLHSYILGGGLNSGNVQKVLRELKPSILDIASGVEKTVRTKSETLIEEFCSNARTLSNEAFISRLKGN